MDNTIRNANAFGRYLSFIASFMTGYKVTVCVTQNPSYVGYTQMPENGKANIVLSSTSPLYTEEDGTPMEEMKKKFYMQGVMVHECLHLIYTAFSAFNEQIKNYFSQEDKEAFAELNNIVEDPAIEYGASSKFGGPLLKSLDMIIRHTWATAEPIDKEVIVGYEEACAYSQILSALIHIGDRGSYKGEFSCDLARDKFTEILPLFNKAVIEPKGEKRVQFSAKIFSILYPLLKKQRAMQDKIQKMLDSMPQMPSAPQDSGENRNGEDVSRDGTEEDNNAKRRKTLEEKVLEEAAKRQAQQDGQGEESGRQQSANDSSEGKDGSGEGTKSEDGRNEETGDGSKAGDESKDDKSQNGSNSKNGDGSDKKGEKQSSSESEKDKSENSSKKEASDGKNGDDSDKDANKKSDKDSKKGDGSESKDTDNGSPSKGEDKEPKIRGRGVSGESFEAKENTEDDIPEITADDLAEIESGIKKAEETIKAEEEAEFLRQEQEVHDIPSGNAELISLKDVTRVSEYDRKIYDTIKDGYSLKINALYRSLKEIFKGDIGAVRNSSRGSRINLKRVASPVLHPDIMKKRIGPKDLSNMAVYLLVDESGSMGCKALDTKKNSECARETAICLYEALRRLNIPIFVSGFTTDGRKAFNRHFVTWRSPESDKYKLGHISAYNGNYDGLSIDNAHEALQKFSAKHKLLIVISDGAPCSRVVLKNGLSVRTEGKVYTKASIENARKDTSLLGVALNCHDAKEYNYMYGKDYIKVSTADDVFLSIAASLKDIVKNW